MSEGSLRVFQEAKVFVSFRLIRVEDFWAQQCVCVFGDRTSLGVSVGFTALNAPTGSLGAW